MKMLTQCLLHPTYSVLKIQKMASRNFLQSLLKIPAKMSMQIISRNYLTNSQIKHLTAQNIQRQINVSYILVQQIINSGHVKNINSSGNRMCCRLYSDMKDDETLKSWLNEIKEDFEKDQKVSASDNMSNHNSDKMNTSSSDDSDSLSDSDSDNLHDSLDDDFDKLEKLGFTTEEIIDLLKKSKSIEHMEEEFEESDTEHTDEFNPAKDNVESHSDASTNVNEDNALENSNIDNVTSKMEAEKWAVVEMNTDGKTDWSAVEIEDFVNIAEAAEETEDTWELPVDLVRGKHGVFEIEELIKVLRAANAQDIVAIKIPENVNFADYMVIVSAKSLRHIQAILGDIRWIHKRKKNKKDKYMRVEGAQSEWCAVDLGNIVLHVFMPALRELYDLETLWTVGAKFDPQCAEESADPYVFSADDLPWLKELEKDAAASDGQKN